MKFFGNTLGLLLASLALASCGGGGSNGGAFSPPQSGSITLTATTTTLPLNTSGQLPHEHGSSQAEVNISLRNADGSLMAGHDVSVSISPVNVAAISVLADGTATVDDLWGTYTIKGTNGQATAWVNARQIAGTAVFTASATDPTTSRTISATMTFTVTSGVGPAPANVALASSPSGVYLPSSGGINTSQITATVRDGGGQLVPDPLSGNSGVDNIQFEIVGNAGDARLSSNSVAGAVSGTSVLSHTVHGVATVSFQAGDNTPQGLVQIRATVDRADNNVSNGIQDPVSSTTSIAVSDGKLHAVHITSPDVDAILQNMVTRGIDTSGAPLQAPDGTYSLTVSAEAKDRQGRPVIPGTVLQFGLVDGPLAGFPNQGGGVFQISGNDGNPQEGGTVFSAPTGHFRTAGGGAGPGDTVLVFGQSMQGNADLENARIVQSVSSETGLNVVTAFNRNDTSGSSVDYGPVLPYVIGRASEANITATGRTNAAGVATVALTYPVNRLGKAVIIWAQGNASTTAVVKTATDIEAMRLPGVAPARFIVSPTPIAGNGTLDVAVCLRDAHNSPLQGVAIGFSFTGLGVGSGSVDGVSTAGAVNHPTGSDGCTVAHVVTAGIGASQGDANLSFAAGETTVDVPIMVGSDLVLQAAPSSVGPGGGTVTLRLTDGSGNPVPGAQLSGTCAAGAGLAGMLGATNASGSSSVAISNTLDLVCVGTAPKTSTCTFTTSLPSGPSVVVNVVGGVTSAAPPCAAPPAP